MPPFSRGRSVLLRMHGARIKCQCSRAANKLLIQAWNPGPAFTCLHLFSSSQKLRPATKKSVSSSQNQASRSTKPKSFARPFESKLRIKAYQPQTSAPYKSFTPMGKLLRSPTPTLLYQGTSQASFTAVCFATGILTLASSAYIFYAFYGEIVNETTTQMVLVRLTEGATAVLLVGFGALALSRPFSLIKSIKAIPINGVASRQLALDIESQPVFPWRKGRVIRRLSSELKLNRSLVSPSPSLPRPKEGVREQAIEARETRKKDRERAVTRILAWPFRTLARGFGVIFLATKKMFSTRHLRYIDIPGVGTWKLDLAGAWTLDNGRSKLLFSEAPNIQSLLMPSIAIDHVLQG